MIGPNWRPQSCYLNYFIVTATNPLIFIIALPVYELVVYPVVYKYMLPMASRIGVGFLLGLFSIVFSMIIYALPERSPCILYTTDHPGLNVHEWMVVVTLFLSTFAEMLVYIPSKLI